MSWIAILAVAAVAFLIAAFVLRMPREGWALMGATLLFGLAGYALQGNPTLPAAPKAAQSDVNVQDGEAVVLARRTLFAPTDAVPGYLTISDGFARRGRYQQAAELLQTGLQDNPKHGEGWLALALALTEHAKGQVTPPAIVAFGKAEETLPGNPAPAYFLGSALLRSGRPLEAKEVWTDLLVASPDDAPWIEDLQFRIAQIDRLIELMEQQNAN